MKKLPLAKDETLFSLNREVSTCSKLNYIKQLNSLIYNAKKQNKNLNWSRRILKKQLIILKIGK